jgi:hypothetical protein
MELDAMSFAIGMSVGLAAGIGGGTYFGWRYAYDTACEFVEKREITMYGKDVEGRDRDYTIEEILKERNEEEF